MYDFRFINLYKFVCLHNQILIDTIKIDICKMVYNRFKEFNEHTVIFNIDMTEFFLVQF